MSADFAIRAEGLGKRFLIGHEREAPADTFVDALSRSVAGFTRSARAMAKGGQLVAGDTVEEFWALRHINFEIAKGDIVGIIGRNGAGKSTLLKILSRITEPTEGRVEIRGRASSLLEVGTGFHPELTGRENVFLNGAILGMTRKEIQAKFDEIVDFAGVEKFIDTPVKRYSSGMQVRLAFAVAAHLEPEILIVDEVLAVGDAEFQGKCLGKMKDVAGNGRTVLFVSHNLGAVRALCTSGFLMQDGECVLSGAVNEVVSEYLDKSSGQKGCEQGHFIQPVSEHTNQEFVLNEVCIRGVKTKRLGVIEVDEQIRIDVKYSQRTLFRSTRIVLFFKDHENNLIFATSDETVRRNFATEVEPSASFISRLLIPSNLLLPGRYSVELRAAQPKQTVFIANLNVCEFTVVGMTKRSGLQFPPDRWHGVVTPDAQWTVESVPSENVD